MDYELGFREKGWVPGRGNGIGAGRGRNSENEEVATSPVGGFGSGFKGLGIRV